MNDCGVYRILNLINEKFYIGSSRTLRARELNHFNKLRNKKHINPHLQFAFNKYGEDAFVFEVIEETEEENQFEREQYWIDNTDFEQSYNIERKAQVFSGITRQKMSEAWKGRVISEETRQKYSLARKGKKVTGQALENSRAAQLENSKKRQAPIPDLISPCGELVSGEVGYGNFCRKHGLDRSTLRRVIKGKENQHKGWRLHQQENKE